MRNPTCLIPAGIRRVLLFGVLALVVGAVPARAWWNNDWTLRKKIVVDLGAPGPAAADPGGAIPVLLRLHDGNFHFADAKPDGADLRFVATDDHTLLPYHVEKFDPLLNEAFVWVRVPEVKPGVPATFWLYYGNTGAKVVRADDPKGTYDGDTTLVYHFSEHGQPATDASASGTNAQNAGLASEGAFIGTGLRIDGKTTVTIPASPALFWTGGSALTWSAWVKPGAPQPDAVVFSRHDGSKGLLIGFDKGAPFVEVSDAGGTFRSPAAAALPAGAWHHFAVVAAGEKIMIYLDGEVSSTLAAPLPALNGPAVIGGNGVGGLLDASTPGFSGELDELQIARVARPAGWVRFAAQTQGGEHASKMIAVGEDEQPSNWLGFLKNGYIGVIIGSLTVDGWVVIIVLAIMSVISWLVMISKALYLNRIGRGNSLFLKQWGQISGDLAAFDHTDAEQVRSLGGRVDAAGQRALRQSPLFRIYHLGAEEIQQRLSANTDKGLSSLSIQAIRASLDGGLVRESQKLSSLMVLLTIAISGGPFLGLLGTVVGVMITFAAVAAAGDVNVNAIAPGIAAALAATVAGLAVAIPALFGYNYLLTRIKETTSDMHVFIDDFVTKMAEHYADAEKVD